jgi:hypothetical protein
MDEEDEVDVELIDPETGEDVRRNNAESRRSKLLFDALWLRGPGLALLGRMG